MFWENFEGERVLRQKISSPFKRARRVVLGTSMEHLEYVPRRIRGGITGEKRSFEQYSGYFWCYNKSFCKSDGSIG